MKKGLIVLGVILAVIFVFGASLAGSYNSLVSLDEEVNLSQSNIETMLQRRADLIPNLVNTVKAYSKHEEKVFGDIANARAALNSSIESGDVEEMQKANTELSKQLSRLLVVVENYPDLKAGEQYTALMDQLEGSENRISIAREEYNSKVTTYNKKIRSFPTSILAGMFGFEKRKPFEADKEATNVPVVNFE